jgi:hypothetical protein
MRYDELGWIEYSVQSCISFAVLHSFAVCACRLHCRWQPAPGVSNTQWAIYNQPFRHLISYSLELYLELGCWTRSAL